MSQRMGLLGTIFKIVAVIVLLVVGLGAYLYFTDYAANATVTSRASQTECGGDSDCWVEVTPTIYPFHYKKTLDVQTWGVVCVGYKVTFHLQTQHYQVFDKANTLIYDSVGGLQDRGAAVRCALSNV
ncbi:MAG: hypothetical protein WDA16_02535 [Candidatus Thermoplasmatota archaeon]